MLKNSFLTLLLTISFTVQTTEYVYPVSVLDHNTILLIQQKMVDNIVLWIWNNKTNTLKSGLLSRFNPANLCLLPDKSGFSFIDNGLLKIKLFYKRSPKTIPLDEPLYDIAMVQWIDNYYCYTSAKNDNYFGIFQLSIKGDVDCIVKIPFADCLYPQKIDDLLFYIERKKNNYRIMSISYPNIPQNNNFDETTDFDMKVEKIIERQTKKEIENRVINKQLILDFKRQPIAFLHMISDNEGFVLEYDSYIDEKDDTILFSYLHLTKSGDSWHYNQLFSFSIPTLLLLTNSPTRLYESILPLLPRHINNTIYYVDSLQQKYLNIFCYDLNHNKIEQKTFSGKKGKSYFSPFLVDGQLIFGGSV